LKGLDASLELNLESTYLLDYPYYEICFSLEFDSDPALDVVKKLQLKYPNVKTRVIIGCENVGINPKINNLIQGYKETTSELVWILDSNIMVTPATLRNSVALLKDDNIGLVHHVPIAHQLESVGSFMEGVFLSCTHLKLYSFINWLHISCVIGKSNLYKRRDLDALGGLQQFGNIMAEDSVIGYRLRSLGKDDIIGQDFVYQSLGNISFSDFIFRRARWIRLRKFSQPLVPMYECITESLPCGILGALSFNHYFGWSIKYFFCVHMIIWFLADMFVGYIAYRKFPLNYVESIKLICSWVVREIVAVPVHLWAISGKYIRWRGKVYKLLYDGTGTIIKSDN
jgi:ceramide glucosyltransferase